PYPDRLGQVIGRAQSLKLIIEDSPKVLLAFHGELPAFAQLGHKMGRELFGCQGQSLSLVGRDISPNEKTGGAHNVGIRHEQSTAARFKFIPNVHGEVKLRCGKDVATDRSRRGTIDTGDLSL